MESESDSDEEEGLLGAGAGAGTGVQTALVAGRLVGGAGTGRREAVAGAQGMAWVSRLAARATALVATTAVGAPPGAATALGGSANFLFWTGLMASAIRQRPLRRGGTLAGEASGGGWRE